MKEVVFRSGVGLLALVVATPVLAQAGPPASPDSGPPLQQQAAPPASSDRSSSQQKAAATTNGVEDIVVTAQRRNESLQNVPIAATVLSSEGLREKAVTHLSDLQYASPSLTVTDNGLVQYVNIRGIGITSSQASVANGVATYVDGLFQPPIVGLGSFYDIASIEVLRGPQGTLVGSNSTGGAVLITSENPSTARIGGYLEGSYGNYDSKSLDGAINVPITDNLAIRAAGLYRQRDSYYTDVGPAHTNAGSLDERSERLGLIWTPGDFQLLIKSEFTSRDTGGFAMRPGLNTPYASERKGNDFTLNYDFPTRDHQFANINSAELRYTTAGGVTIRSISGYQNKHVNLLVDQDATSNPADKSHVDQYVRERQYTEEINIISPTTGRFSWILGGYFQRNDIQVNLFIDQFPRVYVDSPTHKTTTGVFARGVYSLTNNLQLELGARYSHYHVSETGVVRLPDFGLIIPSVGTYSDGRVTGKAALNWKVTPNNLLYVFAARGYKPGGFDNTQSFGPETVWNYEIGWKANLAENHIRTQLDAFYNDYHGFQFSTTAVASGQPNQTNVTNLPTATIKGIEAQIQAKFGGLQVDAGGAYIDSKLPAFRTLNASLLPGGVGNFPQCGGGLPANQCFDFTPYFGTAGGGPNLLSPKWTYNAGVQYSFPVGSNAKLTPRINYAYVSSQFAGLFYDPVIDKLPSRGLVSALLTLEMKGWRVEAYGQNLANKYYVSGKNGANDLYGAPREYGVRASVKF